MVAAAIRTVGEPISLDNARSPEAPTARLRSLHGTPALVGPGRTATPFLKWAGGKTKLLAALTERMPAGRLRYGEPFVGGGAVFFHLASENRLDHALLCDNSTDVVLAHRTVRDDLPALVRLLRQHERAYLAGDDVQRSAYFYAVRDRQPVDVPMPDLERAARMLFLNRTCYNGLWRENSKGRFNAPHGRYENPAIVQEDKLVAAGAALQGTAIERADFRDLPRLVREHGLDFVYLDPPYHPVSATSSFNAYSGGQFSARSQADLAEVCGELDAMGVRWMLSNSDCAYVRELYRRWTIHEVRCPRAVNSRADRRGDVGEVVVTNRRPGLRW